jgi:alpha-galactosidase
MNKTPDEESTSRAVSQDRAGAPRPRRRSRARILAAALAILAAAGIAILAGGYRTARQINRNRDLVRAVVRVDVPAVSALLDAGADPNTHNEFLTAHAGITKGTRAFVRSILGLRGTTPRGRVLLSIAMRHNSAEIVRLLLEHGANVNDRDAFGRTPLGEATTLRNEAWMAELKRRGANPSAPDVSPPDTIWLDSLDVTDMSQPVSLPHQGITVGLNPLKLHGVLYPHGIGTHANSEWVVSLHGSASRLTSVVGVDDECGTQGSIRFEVLVDGKRAALTDVLRGGGPPASIDVSLAGAQLLTLRVLAATDNIAHDHADWGAALIHLNPGARVLPEPFRPPWAPPRMTVPAADNRPQIHGPRVVGATPDRPFLFRIPATGARPMRFEADGLPPGLTLDGAKGVLSGALQQEGKWRTTLRVRNRNGLCARPLDIVGGDMLALTPPMGWTTWNAFGIPVDQARVLNAARRLVSLGLADHGYVFVDVDDGWAGKRDASGEIMGDARFPDIPGLSAAIHGLGLKFGIYSTPGPVTCWYYPGSYGHEAQDAATYARWGADFLKYDWCSYEDIATGTGQERLARPYDKMYAELRRTNRDVVYNRCQFGYDGSWDWGGLSYEDRWRDTGDITDRWGSIRCTVEEESDKGKFVGPGHWNDLDMLVVGLMNWQFRRQCRLTPNEQLVHISLWSMMAAALVISCDLDKLDPQTMAVLTNDEVLEVDQDPLGRPASRLPRSGFGEVWWRPLYDGSKAVCLVNTGPVDAPVRVDWKSIGLSGSLPVRDLWLHKDLGLLRDGYSVEVPTHGCVMLKVGQRHLGR